jgi:ketosteroid isomerase-like protein
MKAGLCDSCRHQKLIANTRGSTFSMCERSKTDERYPKYPRLPVVECDGWEGRGAKIEIARRAVNELGSESYEDGVWHPDVEVINAQGWVIATSYHGHAGLQRWWEDLAEAFGDFRIELEEVLEIDDERVVTTQRFVGHFRATDIPFDGLWASILWIREGKIVRAQGYLSKRRALRAAGVAEG